MEQDNSNNKVNIVRPPELWNFPKVIEEGNKGEHKFRSIADPKGKNQKLKSYILRLLYRWQN